MAEPLPHLSSFERLALKARGVLPSGFALAKRISLGVSPGLGSISTDELKALHSSGMARFRENALAGLSGEETGEATLLDAKRELARRLLSPCRLCALRCEVDRLAGPAGACGLGAGVARYLDFVHEGEEPEISPTHAILLAGCNYRCSYCSDWPHVDSPQEHLETSPDDLARSIERRREDGVASLSWIGGEPLVNLPGILDALARARTSVPVVWNSNMHATREVQDLLEGIVDSYVADWKHGNEACALSVARAPAHFETVREAILRASREAFTIVRHLVLPGHVECCTLPVLEAIARDLPGIRVNLMAQFRPNANVRGTPLDRRPSNSELEAAFSRARKLGLDLSPRGKLEGPGRLSGKRAREEDLGVPFESSIYLDADGSVTIEHLSPDLSSLARTLGESREDDRPS